MHISLEFTGVNDTAELRAAPGLVTFNGARLLPHEAAILSDRLRDCAQHATAAAEKLRDSCNEQMHAAAIASQSKQSRAVALA